MNNFWILPTMIAIVAIVFGYRAYKDTKLGDIYKSGEFWFFVAFIVATIILVTMFNKVK